MEEKKKTRVEKRTRLTDEGEPERLAFMIKKTKGLLGNYVGVGNFEEPILLLIRRGGKVEFYEGANQSQLKYTHSDGDERLIHLTEKKLISFPHGKQLIKGYICHEDIGVPLPEDPLLSTELTGIALDKTLNDVRKWKAEELKQKANIIWYLGGAIAIIILAYAMYVMLKPQPQQIIERVVEVTTTTLPIIVK